MFDENTAWQEFSEKISKLTVSVKDQASTEKSIAKLKDVRNKSTNPTINMCLDYAIAQLIRGKV